MALSRLIIATETVEIPGDEPLVVRGLGVVEAVHLARSFFTEMQNLFDKAVAGELHGFDVEQSLLMLGEQGPRLIGNIIACAADEPDQWGNAMRLPLGVQLDALEKIGILTFGAEGGVEKFLGTVIKMLSGAADLQAKLLA